MNVPAESSLLALHDESNKFSIEKHRNRLAVA